MNTQDLDTFVENFRNGIFVDDGTYASSPEGFARGVLVRAIEACAHIKPFSLFWTETVALATKALGREPTVSELFNVGL